MMRFRKEMDNHSLPTITRKRAAHAYYRIKRQLRDRYLTKLRYEYMRADAANDAIAREHIGDRVSAHMYRVYKRRI